MPYLCAVFDESMQTAISEAATRFASSSAFTFEADKKFHIPLIGSLHVYTSDEIGAAVEEGFKSDPTALEGLFLRWEASKNARLRIVVSLADHRGLVTTSQRLSRGREWRDELYVDVGSLTKIDEAQWDEFVDAVIASFPIISDSKFVCTHLDYIDKRCWPTSKAKSAARPKKTSRIKSSLNPNAAVFRPSSLKVSMKAQRRTPKTTKSPHKKGERPGASVDALGACMDLVSLMDTTSRKNAIRKKVPHRRATQGK